MPTGLVALLDDISVIARAASASLDDVAAGVAKAGTKAAGVVIDDAAVTPGYVTRLEPARELPIIWKIALGSLRNKLVILLPGALLLSAFLPVAITPLLMLGGLYLAFEGAEKVLEKLGTEKLGETLEDPITDMVAFEDERVAGAIRTDLILSAEIMAIALAEVSGSPPVTRAATLAIVGVIITIAVYGTVAFIVKMDDVGLHLARRSSAVARRTGELLVSAMPALLWLLSNVGTVAMLWVGGGILLHGLEVLGLPKPAHVAHDLSHHVETATGAFGSVAGWLTYATLSAAVGMGVGAILATIVHFAHGKGHANH
jgi:uncharacterized protein